MDLGGVRCRGGKADGFLCLYGGAVEQATTNDTSGEAAGRPEVEVATATATANQV